MFLLPLLFPICIIFSPSPSFPISLCLCDRFLCYPKEILPLVCVVEVCFFFPSKVSSLAEPKVRGFYMLMVALNSGLAHCPGKYKFQLLWPCCIIIKQCLQLDAWNGCLPLVVRPILSTELQAVSKSRQRPAPPVSQQESHKVGNIGLGFCSIKEGTETELKMVKRGEQSTSGNTRAHFSCQHPSSCWYLCACLPPPSLVARASLSNCTL